MGIICHNSHVRGRHCLLTSSAALITFFRSLTFKPGPFGFDLLIHRYEGAKRMGLAPEVERTGQSASHNPSLRRSEATAAI